MPRVAEGKYRGGDSIGLGLFLHENGCKKAENRLVLLLK